MITFPEINNLKFKYSRITKKERLYTSIYPKKFQKELESNNNLLSIIHIPPNNISYNNKKKHNHIKFFTAFTQEKEKINLEKNLKKQMKIIDYLTENLKSENEIIRKKIEFNKTYKGKRSFYPNNANYSRNFTNIIHNKPIDIDKFIEDINSFLLPNEKTFEIIQNLINDKIKNNKETQKLNCFSQLLNSKEILINSFNYELIFRNVFNNTFKEAFKKALLNNSLINKDDIKKEYQKQINDIKQNLNLLIEEKKNLTNNQKCSSLIINKNSFSLGSHLNNDKFSSKRNNKKINLEMYNRKNIQTKSSDNIFLNHKKNNKELIFFKNVKTNSKRNTLYENYVKGVILKTKMDNVKETKLKNIIRKQKIIIDNYRKSKEKIKNDHDILIKAENSVQKSIKVFDFLSNKKNKNKNQDIINYINNNERNIKFDNLLIKKIFNKSSIKRLLFDEKINKGKNSFNDNYKNDAQQNKKLIKENSCKLFNTGNESIKEYEERKEKAGGIKISLKKKNALNIKTFKDYLRDENYIPQINELNNKVEEKSNFTINAYKIKIK